MLHADSKTPDRTISRGILGSMAMLSPMEWTRRHTGTPPSHQGTQAAAEFQKIVDRAAARFFTPPKRVEAEVAVGRRHRGIASATRLHHRRAQYRDDAFYLAVSIIIISEHEYRGNSKNLGAQRGPSPR